MCSYNRLNNSYGCGNSYSLNHLLKTELGFQGFVVCEWSLCPFWLPYSSTSPLTSYHS